MPLIDAIAIDDAATFIALELPSIAGTREWIEVRDR